MERRKALAVASAATLALGGAVVGTASVSGASFLGFGGTKHGPGSFAATVATEKPRVVVRKRDVYDRYVVDTGAPTSAGSGSSNGSGYANAPAAWPGAPQPAGAPTPRPTPTTARHTRSSRTPATTVEPPESGQPSAGDPPTAGSTVPTTTPSAPTTTPPGVPADWPANQPIPPMPPNCQQPQLELNGVWNCQNYDN